MKNVLKRMSAACLALIMAFGVYAHAAPIFIGGNSSAIVASAAESEKEITAGDYAELKGGLAIGKKYKVDAKMVKFDDKSSLSMSDAAIDRQVTVEYKNGQYYVTVK